MSFFSADHEWWCVASRLFPKPWPQECALLDLRAMQSAAVAPYRPEPFPSRRALASRWGWSEGMVRAMLANEGRWSDPFIVGDRERSSRWSDAVGERSSRNHKEPESYPTTTRELPENSPTTNGNASVSPTAEPESYPTTTRPQPDDRHTRVGSQSTEHRAQTQEEHTAPVPVAALFPMSHPDSHPATVEDTGDTNTHPPVTPPTLPADVLEVIAVLAKLNPSSAARMGRGTNEGMVKATRKAIKAMTLPVLLARLEYAALVQDDEPMRFWRTTLGGKLAPLLTVDGPWVRGLDEAAAEGVEVAEVGADTSGADPRALAVAAWAAMTMVPAFRGISGTAPNRPEAFGSPARWDMADTADEHARRFECFREAGSIPVWREANDHGRAEFRQRWIAAYMAKVQA